MSLENASQADSSATTTESVSTESQPASQESSSQASVQAPVTGEAQPQYTPNFEFKVYDKVHQFPEWARPVIKDKATEEQIRDVFSRAYGLDGLKGKYEKSKEQLTRYADVEKNYNNQTGQLKQLLALRETDMGAFLQAVGLDDDKLAQHYQAILRAKEDPTFAAQYNAGLEAKRKHLQVTQEQEEMRSQMDSLRQEKEQILLERHVNTFESTYNNPQVSSFAQAFDAKAGKEGAFKDEAMELGNFIFMKEQRNASPTEVFSMLMQKYSAFVQPQTTPMEAQPQMAAKSQPATIPNTGGAGGVSVTKPRFNSIDDIKKHYNKNFGE
jgi:hypothetical protein